MMQNDCCPKTRTAITVAVIIATFLLMAGLVRLMIAYTQAPSTAATRAKERATFLDEYRNVNAPLLESYGSGA